MLATAPAAAMAQRHWQRGVAYKAQGLTDRALKAFRLALRLQPDDGVYALNLAHVLALSGDAEAALEAARRTLRLDPHCTVASLLAADQLLAQNRFDEAVTQLDTLAEDAPRGRDFHLRLATALLGDGRPQRAVDVLLTAIGEDLGHAPSHHSLGVALGELRMFEEAAEAHRTAWLLAPERSDALALSVNRNQHACRWTSFDADREILERAYAGGSVASSIPFALISLPLAPATQRAAAAATAAVIESAVACRTRTPPPLVRRRAAGRLRVGYVSNDFQKHATMQLIIEMLESHDREAFEVTLYAHNKDDGSPMRRRSEAACERFVDISRASDDQAAARIRADGIDLLIDLKGYTAGQRLGIFAHRPAPVQVGFLGYPGTSGGRFLDYFVGDPVTTPPEVAVDFSEKLAQMPLCYQPNDSQRSLPAPLPRSACGLPEAAFVLCSFNQSYKITPAVFDTWCGLLHDIPGSVLWLLECNPQARRNLQREAAQRGVDPLRLIFAPPLDIEAHLARLQAADLSLDTAPYGAHTTASDALWVGLPLVTVLGSAFASRVAASLLCAQGVPELVAPDLDQYAAIVRALASDPARLALLRARLAGARHSSGLFDGRRFARDLESLYRRMAERQAAGLPPDHLLAQGA